MTEHGITETFRIADESGKKPDEDMTMNPFFSTDVASRAEGFYDLS